MAIDQVAAIFGTGANGIKDVAEAAGHEGKQLIAHGGAEVADVAAVLVGRLHPAGIGEAAGRGLLGERPQRIELAVDPIAKARRDLVDCRLGTFDRRVA